MELYQGKYTKWFVFAITGIANLIVSFSINSLILALPLLQKEFDVSQNAVSWLAMVYSLVPCCTLLIFGRTAELFGYKRQFKAGFLFYGAICLAAPLLSKNIGLLIFFRCLQGLGYSIIISITMAVVSRSFPENERGKALGINSVFVSVGLAAGPTVGGFLLMFFSWRALFYFNIPFCLFGFWATCRFLPPDNSREPGKGHMDITGALLLAFFIGALVIGLNFGYSWTFTSRKFLFCMAAGAAGLCLFIRRETRAAFPLMRLHLFKNKTFSLANMTCMISYLVQQLITYLMPFYLINTLLLHAGAAGLIMLASPLLMMAFSPVGGILCDKKGPWLPISLGLIMIGAGCLIMILLGRTAVFGVAIATLMLAGAGNGFSVASINTTIMSTAPKEHMGIASGMLATMRNFGQTLGVLSGTVIFSLRQPVYSLFPERKAYLFAQRDTLIFGFFMVLIAILLVRMLPRGNRRQTKPDIPRK